MLCSIRTRARTRNSSRLGSAGGARPRVLWQPPPGPGAGRGGVRWCAGGRGWRWVGVVRDGCGAPGGGRGGGGGGRAPPPILAAADVCTEAVKVRDAHALRELTDGESDATELGIDRDVIV